jgi:hypothetical protein
MAASPASYPWYGVTTGEDLEQGHILRDCPVFVIPPAAVLGLGEHPIQVQRQNVIVMTQSCDLARRADGRCAVDEVLLCPVYFKHELQADKRYGQDAAWEEARRGRHGGVHVLHRCDIPGCELEFMLVDLRRVYSLSVDMLRAFAAGLGNRVCLLPPYREHLSQAFARFFMRVGLPADIPPFGKKK